MGVQWETLEVCGNEVRVFEGVWGSLSEIH